MIGGTRHPSPAAIEVPAAVAAELPGAPRTHGAPRRLIRCLLARPAGLIGAVLTAALVLVGVLAPLLVPHDPFAIAGPPLASPSLDHPMGTDALGRDLFSMVVFGARTALIVAGAVGALVLLFGVTVGMLSSWWGGWGDDVLMRLTELFQVLPRFFLALLVIAFFGPGLDVLIAVLGLTSWPVLARVVRSQVLSLREREFVEAARASGASGTRIVIRELLPNALPGAIAMLGLILAQVLLIEAGLAFVGLGDPGIISWGALASDAQGYLRVAWWLALFPGLAIALAVLGLNLLSDALTDVLGSSR